MAYEKPTPADIKTRFPEFTSETDERIQLFIDDASLSVDESWLEADYKIAISYLTAHLLALGNETSEGADIGVKGNISSESFSGMSISYGSGGTDSGVSKSQYGSTAYGRRYWQLLQGNKGGPLVVT